jgi:hypothetical protein
MAQHTRQAYEGQFKQVPGKQSNLWVSRVEDDAERAFNEL